MCGYHGREEERRKKHRRRLSRRKRERKWQEKKVISLTFCRESQYGHLKMVGIRVLLQVKRRMR